MKSLKHRCHCVHCTLGVAALCMVQALSGCATIERHPVATAVVIAVVAGSVAATVEAEQHHHTQPTWVYGKGPGPEVRP